MATVEAVEQAPDTSPKWRLPSRLPPLSGWVLVAYRVLWCVVTALALASLTLSYRTEVAGQRSARAFYDLGLIQMAGSAAGPVVQPFSPQAKRLFSGRETLLAVNGRALPVDREGRTQAVSGPDGASVSVALMRADGSRHRVALTRSSGYLTEAYAGTGMTWAARRWIEFGLSRLAGLLWLVTGLLLFRRRPRDPVAALIAMGAVLGALGGVGLHALWPSASILVDVILAYIFNASLMLGLLTFPDGWFRPRWSRSLAMLSAPMVLISVCLIRYSITLSGLLLASAINGILLIALIAAIVGRYRATPPGTARQQIKLAIFGFVVGIFLILVGFFCNAMASGVVNERARVWWLLGAEIVFGFGSMALFGGLLFSLLRYRLYDADTAISRSVAYGALTLVLLAIFAGSENMIEILGQEYFGKSLGTLAGGIGAAVAAVMIVPLHHRIEHWAEKHFQKQLIELRHGLPLLVGDLREMAGLEGIAAAVLDAVAHGVRANWVTLLVGGDLIEARGIAPSEVEAWRASWTSAAHDGLDSARGDPLFPLRVPLDAHGHDRVGWLLLGPRPDGSFYGKDEREALAEIAGPVARALEIVRMRCEEKQKMETRIAGLEAVVGDFLSRDACLPAR